MDEAIQSLVTAKEIGHTVVDVEDLVNSMKKKLDSISEPPSPPLFQICRVPVHIRKGNHVYYNPKIVSIGPFHRPTRNLRAMEEHKWRYLRKFIHRVSEPYQPLERCVEEMKNMVEEVRKCYSGNTLNLCDVEFVKMMLLDGCFVIQILLFLQEAIEENDPIVNNEWMLPLIIHDMLLLENQLPFSVLKCLAKLIGQTTATLKKKAIELLVPAYNESAEHDQHPFSVLKCLANLIGQTTDTLEKKAIEFLAPDSAQSTKNESPEHETNIHHLLHLVHSSLKPPTFNAKPCCSLLLQVVRKILSSESPRCLANYELLTEVQEAGASSSTVQPQEAKAPSITLNSIPTATELVEAGVVFERNEKGSLLDVTFKKGVMRLPRLQIADHTNSLFRNIIAFEQCFPDSGGVFTSYCFFMDSLVNTQRDVQILKQSDIIEHMLGSDEEVALLFNQLCKEIAGDLGKGSVGKACVDVDKYAKTKWHKWRARLMHDYFSNPWAVISLIAAVYALIVTSVSTYYSVF